MNKATLEAFLGRPLTSVEDTNIKLYTSMAYNMLARLLCSTICSSTEARYFDARAGYRTLFTDIFSSINSITVDGVEVTDYVMKQNDNRNGDWFNSIVFTDKMVNSEILIDANWGFDKVPTELQDLTAKLFNLVSARNITDSRITTKKIEDFSVSYRDITPDDQLLADYSQVISKYSQCQLTGEVRHGSICHI